MTKVELSKAVAQAINESKDKKATKVALIASIETIMAEYNRSTSKKDEHPNILDENGSVKEVWCNKHLQYEPAEDFAKVEKSKTGYHNKCKIADYQWRDYLKQIKDIENNIITALDTENYEDAKNLHNTKKSLILAKDSSYEYPDTEEIDRITPSK